MLENLLRMLMQFKDFKTPKSGWIVMKNEFMKL